MGLLWGGVEAGGTKFVCAVGSGPDDVLAETRILTASPEETIGCAATFFSERQEHHGASLSGLGIASFGPLDLEPGSPKFGFITTTPKPGWAFTDLLGAFRRGLEVPVGIDTDVNAAALGEQRWGAAKGLDTFIYLTVGTGIGGGGLVNGRPMHGLVHPEMGHIRIPHDTVQDPFPGVCPYHGDCLEGLASGPAMEKRWGAPAESLSSDHPAWALEARYLALALVDYICTLSPKRIVMGGGVMQQASLFPMVRREVLDLLKGYVRAPEIQDGIDRYIVPPGLGSRSGVLGAIAIALSLGAG